MLKITNSVFRHVVASSTRPVAKTVKFSEMVPKNVMKGGLVAHGFQLLSLRMPTIIEGRFFTTSDTDKGDHQSINDRLKRQYPGIENTDIGFRQFLAEDTLTIEQQFELDCLNDQCTLRYYLPADLFHQENKKVLEVGCHVGSLVPALFKTGILSDDCKRPN